MTADERFFEGGKEWGVIKEVEDMEKEGSGLMLFLFLVCLASFLLLPGAKCQRVGGKLFHFLL